MTDLIKRLDDFQEKYAKELESLRLLIESEQTVDVNNLDDGDRYFHINDEGEVRESEWYELVDSDVHRYSLMNNNVFKTRAEAVYHLELVAQAWDIKQKSIESMKKFNAERFGTVYTISYDQDYKTPIAMAAGWIYIRTTFSSKKDCEDIIAQYSPKKILYMLEKGLI